MCWFPIIPASALPLILPDPTLGLVTPMTHLNQLIYETSLLLRYPVLALLGFCFVRMLWQSGELLLDFQIMRRHQRPEQTQQLRNIESDENNALQNSLQQITLNPAQHFRIRQFAESVQQELTHQNRLTLTARIEHLIHEQETDLLRDVNQVRMLVRLGPCLGLAGTLIPLGPGLLALSQGDLSRLSAQLVLAFSTTVIGLLVGGVCYVVALSRAQMADRIAGDLELVGKSVRELLQTDSEQIQLNHEFEAEPSGVQP